MKTRSRQDSNPHAVILVVLLGLLLLAMSTPERKPVKTLKLPGVSAAVSQLLVHMAVVFLATFGASLVAGASTTTYDVPTLEALLWSAAAAGVTAAFHFALGLIPSPSPLTTARFVSLKVVSGLAQVVWSVVVVFLAVFGAQLAAGASGVVSIRSLVALIVAAAVAAVTGAVQAVTRLVPVPTLPEVQD